MSVANTLPYKGMMLFLLRSDENEACFRLTLFSLLTGRYIFVVLEGPPGVTLVTWLKSQAARPPPDQNKNS